jgi:hypothetical protein
LSAGFSVTRPGPTPTPGAGVQPHRLLLLGHHLAEPALGPHADLNRVIKRTEKLVQMYQLTPSNPLKSFGHWASHGPTSSSSPINASPKATD